MEAVPYRDTRERQGLMSRTTLCVITAAALAAVSLGAMASMPSPTGTHGRGKV
jgi:hypothetical protein